MNKQKIWGSSKPNNIVKKDKKKINKKALQILAAVLLFFLIVLSSVAGAFYVFIYQPAILLREDIVQVEQDINAIQQALLNRDLVTLETAMNDTEVSLEALRSSRDEKFAWVQDVTVYNLDKMYSDSDHFINSGLLSLEALKEAKLLAEPFADAAGLRVSEEQELINNEAQGSGLMEALQSWLQIMPEVAENVDGLVAKLDAVGNELNKVDASIYPDQIPGTDIMVKENIENIQNLLNTVTESAPDIKAALKLVP
jgi:hypothetical protein